MLRFGGGRFNGAAADQWWRRRRWRGRCSGRVGPQTGRKGLSDSAPGRGRPRRPRSEGLHRASGHHTRSGTLSPPSARLPHGPRWSPRSIRRPGRSPSVADNGLGWIPRRWPDRSAGWPLSADRHCLVTVLPRRSSLKDLFHSGNGAYRCPSRHGAIPQFPAGDRSPSKETISRLPAWPFMCSTHPVVGCRASSRALPKARRCVQPMRAAIQSRSEGELPFCSGGWSSWGVSHSRPIFTSSRHFDFRYGNLRMGKPGRSAVTQTNRPSVKKRRISGDWILAKPRGYFVPGPA